MTRLLLHHDSLRSISCPNNPGLFDIQDNSVPFLIALQNSRVACVELEFCQLPGHVMVALFQAVSIKTTPTNLYVCDNVRLQGPGPLQSVLEIIPQMQNLPELSINLDFMDESVLSSIRRNTSIQHLYTWNGISRSEEETSEPVLEIMTRNRRLSQASILLDSEPRRTIPLGLWATAIEPLTRDSTGASAAYRIVREIDWWAPQATATAASPPRRPTRVVAAVATSDTTAVPSSFTTKKTDTALTKNDDTMEEGMVVPPHPTRVATVTTSTSTATAAAPSSSTETDAGLTKHNDTMENV